VVHVRDVSDDEVSCFQDKGWAFLPGLLDPDSTARLQARALELFHADRHNKDQGARVDRAFRGYMGEGRESPLVAFLFTPAMGRNAARLLDIPQARLLSSGYLLKMPESASEQQDTIYHQDYPGHAVDRSSFFSMWIALHDMPAAAGTLRFYTGSHRRGVMGQAFVDDMDFRARYKLKDADLSPPLDMRAGDATVHHALTVHGAPANRTSQQRWAYGYILMDADTRHTGAPDTFTDNVKLDPYALFDHPVFPRIPTR
jgi:hypothetical protein